MIANRIGLLRVNISGVLAAPARTRRRPHVLAGVSAGAPLGPPPDIEPATTVTAFLGGFEREIASQAFQRAELTAFMGGGKLDLRDAVLAPAGAVIDVFSVMGGFEIIVPDTWAGRHLR